MSHLLPTNAGEIDKLCLASSATLSFVPTYDFAEANEGFAQMETEEYFTSCSKCICKGCVHSLWKSGNHGKCPYCNSDRVGKTDEEMVEEIMKRVEANDAIAMGMLGSYYNHGQIGLQQDHNKANEVKTGSPTIIVLGSEGRGLRTLVARACTGFVRIPGGGGGSVLGGSSSSR
jgi:hypothetical protein